MKVTIVAEEINISDKDFQGAIIDFMNSKLEPHDIAWQGYTFKVEINPPACDTWFDKGRIRLTLTKTTK